ncbi:MAG: L,D-transpeptidase family protein [Stomatobaculum sp.]
MREKIEAEHPETEHPAAEACCPKAEQTNSPDRRRTLKKAVFAAAAVLFVSAGLYVFRAQRYKSRFFPNTAIDGVDVSEKTAREAEAALNQEIQNYQLTLKFREFPDASLSGEAAGVRYRFDDTFDRLIAAQPVLSFALHYRNATDYRINTIAEFDEEILRNSISRIPALNEAVFRQPVDARISEYTEQSGYTVIPETPGTAIDTEKAEKAIRAAIGALQPELDFSAAELYIPPKRFSDDAALNIACNTLNLYSSTNISYEGRSALRLDGNILQDWLQPEEDGSVRLDEEKLRAFVQRLADAYDTWNKAKTLNSSWGPVVTVKGGSYGWRLNQSAEAEWLRTAITSGTKTARTPEFLKTAASHGSADYGDTYVEVNLTAQHLYFYKNGVQLLSTDFVSGNVARGTITHTGVYQIAYKQRNATLKGQDYSTPVSYWMPFNAGEGLHDAPWRSAFGGSIYRTGGSHGCVNLPPAAAKQLFENVSAGTPVIVYTLAGTESAGGTSAAGAKQPESTAAGNSAGASVPAAEDASTNPSAADDSAKKPSENHTNHTGEIGPGVNLPSGPEVKAQEEKNRTQPTENNAASAASRATVAPASTAPVENGTPKSDHSGAQEQGPGVLKPSSSGPSPAESGPGSDSPASAPVGPGV